MTSEQIPNGEPPIDPLDDTNPSQGIDLSQEPPITLDDTNPSKSQEMRAVQIDEPPIAADDTNPSIALRTGELQGLIDPKAPTVPVWRRALGGVALLAAIGLTLGAVFLLLMPSSDVPEPTIPTQVAVEVTATVAPTTQPPTETPIVEAEVAAPMAEMLPTISPEQMAQLLQQAPAGLADDSVLQVVRNPYEPFTLIPDRPRGEVIPYVIERGDTINGIAEKFGLEPESVVWANSRDIVNLLSPGETINIVPEDGVYVTHVGDRTIADYAAQYLIADPYEIIDSEYNPALRGLTPESIPPSGTQIMIVDGQAEQINWNPTVVREGGSGSDSGGSGGSFITFAPGDPGSCGRVANPGGGAYWVNPLNNYTWIRGFTSYHTGVDLAASVGTPVQAANSGRVIFAGWNSWGYGYTVVLAHGPFTTVYGHLSSIYVSCGQDVGAGTTIAGTGNSGNSTGPHLHFEIRYNDQPQDPTISVGF